MQSWMLDEILFRLGDSLDSLKKSFLHPPFFLLNSCFPFNYCSGGASSEKSEGGRGREILT